MNGRRRILGRPAPIAATLLLALPAPAAEAPRVREARRLVQEAIREADRIEDRGERGMVHRAIVEAQIVLGDLEAARAAAGGRADLVKLVTAAEARRSGAKKLEESSLSGSARRLRSVDLRPAVAGPARPPGPPGTPS